MPTPIANTFYQQAFYQETPDVFWRMHDQGGYLSTELYDAPAGLWRLNGGATDSWTTPHDGTTHVSLPDVITFGVPGPLNDGSTACRFDQLGAGCYIDIGSSAALNIAGNFSLRGWGKTTSAGTPTLISKWDGSHGYFLMLTSGHFRFGCYNATGGAIFDVQTTGTYHDGAYHFFVGTYDGATVRLYVDGVLVFSAAKTGTPNATTGNVNIARTSDGLNYWTGTLFGLAIQKYALTAAQVATYFALRAAGASPSVADVTLNSFDGVAHGGVSAGVPGWSGDTDTAMLFDGTTGYVDVGNVPALAYNGRFSVMAAFKTSGAGAGAVMTLVGKAFSVGPKGWALTLDASGHPRFYAYTSAGVAVFDLTAATACQDNVWHLAIGVYDPVVANRAYLYVDGIQNAIATPAGTPDVNAARVLIGAVDNAGTPAQFFNGGIDEVGVYPYAFRAAQVTALTTARNTLVNGHALMQARAGIMRAGAGRSGFYTARTIIFLNGVDVTARLWKETLQITEQPNEQPDTARCTLFDVPGTLMPSYGQTFIVSDGSADNRVFGGTVVRLTRRSVKNPGGNAVNVTLFDFKLNDWTWLLNRRTVTKTYPAGMLAHLVFQDIMGTFTAGFTFSHVQTTAPALTAPLVFKGTKVASALTALCQITSPNWNWYVDPNLDAHYFLTETSQRPKALAPGNSTYDQLNYTLDLTPIRTRILVEGGGAATTAPAAVGDTSVAVDECGKYSATGGTVVAPEGILITYTGVSASSGPGTLTGIPAIGAGSISVPLLQGDPLNVWVVVDDVAAQAALGALERDQHGNPTDGIHEQPLTVTDGTIAQCQQAANAELAAYRTAVVTGTVWSRDKLMKTGKILSIALPSRGIVVDVTIQQVTRSLMTVNTWQFEVTFATVWRTLVDVLRRVGRAA